MWFKLIVCCSIEPVRGPLVVVGSFNPALARFYFIGANFFAAVAPGAGKNLTAPPVCTMEFAPHTEHFTMTRTLVIGGLGHLGGHTVDALRRRGASSVTIGTRHPFSEGMVRIDLEDRETFPHLNAFDVIVDASDSMTARPDEAIAYCLEHGLTYICTSSEPETLERLTDRFHGHPGPGALILGAGIFTGLSNLVAAQAIAELAAPCDAVDLGIRFSPLSSGGQGMVRLASGYLNADVITFADGARRTTPALERGPVLPFPGKPRATVSVPFGEPIMLRASAGVPNVAAYMAPAPALLTPLLLWTPRWLLSNPITGVLMLFWLTLLRRVLLRWRATPVELVAIARSADGATSRCRLSTRDGMRAAGAAIAALVEEIAETTPRTGGLMIDEITTLDALLPRMRGDRTLELSRG